jgi:hypothetical protein
MARRLVGLYRPSDPRNPEDRRAVAEALIDDLQRERRTHDKVTDTADPTTAPPQTEE